MMSVYQILRLLQTERKVSTMRKREKVKDSELRTLKS